MNKIKLLEQLGADASLQTGKARELMLAEADISEIAETGKLWCLMVPEKDDEEQDTDKNDTVTGVHLPIH